MAAAPSFDDWSNDPREVEDETGYMLHSEGPGGAAHKVGERFGSVSWTDAPLAIIFILSLVGFILIDGLTEAGDDLSDKLLQDHLGILMWTCAISVLVAMTTFVIFFAAPRRFIIIVFGFAIISMGSLVIALFVARSWILGVLFCVVTAGLVVYVMRTPDKQQFGVLLLETSLNLVKEKPVLIEIQALIVMIQMAWNMWWVNALASVINHPAGIVYIFLFGIWMNQVLKNLVAVVTSGTIAAWYFSQPSAKDSVAVPANAPAFFLKRATTVQFGTVCLGSCAESLVRWIRHIFEWMKDSHLSLIASIAHCLFYWFDALIFHFNQYGFTYAAIYGCRWQVAANNAWRLIRETQSERIVRGLLIDSVVQFACVAGGCVATLIVCASPTEHHWYLLLAISWLIGHSTVGVVTQSIEASVSTIIMVFGEDPDLLQRSQPIIAQRFNRLRAGT